MRPVAGSVPHLSDSGIRRRSLGAEFVISDWVVDVYHLHLPKRVP